MPRGLSTFEDVERRFSDSIAEIREKFPERSSYEYSVSNPIAKAMDLSVSEQEGLKVDGFYSEKKIVINQDITYQERKNFSLFHEISHYLLSVDEEIISFLMEFHAGKEEEYQRYIEDLCNLGAGEFLAPIGRIREITTQNKFSIVLLKELDGIFPASKPAIIFQLARAASHKCTIVVIDRKVLPQTSDRKLGNLQEAHVPLAQYYILYSAISRRNKYRPGRYTRVPKPHLLRNAFEEHSFISGKDFIPYKSGNRNHICDCEAMYYQGKVFGLFNLERPPDYSLQPRLF